MVEQSIRKSVLRKEDKGFISGFTVVDDSGTIINPMIIEGQLLDGIGQAMLEQCVYAESGYLQTGLFMDYCMPRADDLPNLTVALTTTMCPHNPLCTKACGEAGETGSPPAIINAITDAAGARYISMPASPEKIWRAIQEQSA